MQQLSGFWHGAMTLSGRLDLSPWVAPDGTAPALTSASGLNWQTVALPASQRTVLLNTPPLATTERFTHLGHATYPPRLAPLPHAPPVLFLRGDASLLREPAVAVVGARRCTGRGRSMAHAISAGLRQAGVVVVSGLAWGIDTAAHRAALDRTIAVLGQGIAHSMTSTQRGLSQEILDAGGLIISEFAPTAPARRRTFPQRNRVIAGLSQATVVVEATLRSGSLITARAALDAGRDVLAVPGHPLDPTSEGCLQLLATGAGLVRHAGDVLTALSLPPPPAPALDALMAGLHRGATVDELCRLTGRSVPDILQTLAALELTAGVYQGAGGRYTIPGSP